MPDTTIANKTVHEYDTTTGSVISLARESIRILTRAKRLPPQKYLERNQSFKQPGVKQLPYGCLRNIALPIGACSGDALNCQSKAESQSNEKERQSCQCR